MTAAGWRIGRQSLPVILAVTGGNLTYLTYEKAAGIVANGLLCFMRQQQQSCHHWRATLKIEFIDHISTSFYERGNAWYNSRDIAHQQRQPLARECERLFLFLSCLVNQASCLVNGGLLTKKTRMVAHFQITRTYHHPSRV